MCILFIYSGEENEDCDYSLILATNRDEQLGRPALPAGFWAEDLKIIGGRDMERGREGGTWLALSRHTNRIGVLLNLMGSPKPDAKGRGSIVSNYVKSGLSTEEYVQHLSPDRELYNDFNLVTVEIGKNSSVVNCYSNTNDTLTPGDGVYLGYSNSLVDTPYKKAVAGRQRFAELCRRWAQRDTEDVLLVKLFELLSWRDKHLPDEELKRRCPRLYEQLGSVFIDMPDEGYGSRAQTVVLVRRSGEAMFIERSLKQPIDPNNTIWDTVSFQFKINEK